MSQLRTCFWVASGLALVGVLWAGYGYDQEASKEITLVSLPTVRSQVALGDLSSKAVPPSHQGQGDKVAAGKPVPEPLPDIYVNATADPLMPVSPAIGDPSESVGAGITVPFYVYEGIPFDWLQTCQTDDYTMGEHKMFKHGNDAWFAEQVQHHPWRVRDPEKALLFVVPVMITWQSRQKLCGKHKSGSLLKEASRQVLEGPWWNRSKGADHLLVSTDFRLYMSNSKTMSKWFPGFIWGVQLSNWQKKLKGACSFAVPVSDFPARTMASAQGTDGG